MRPVSSAPMSVEGGLFEGYELHAPPFDDRDGRALAGELFGHDGDPVELGSHQDRNFLITAADGSRAVLKIANPHFGRTSLEMQNAAMRHVRRAGLAYETPLPVKARSGTEIETVTRDGQAYDVRMVTFVDGTPLTEARHLDRSVRERLGSLAASASLALSDFDHAAADRVLQWDVKHARAVVDGLLGWVQDPGRRSLVERAMAAHDAALERLAPQLRIQVIHGDVTDYNVIGRCDEAGRLQPAGLIDFGDMTRTYLVGEAAVTAAAVAGHDPQRALQAICDVVRGFDAELPLTDDELAALFPLVLGRQASSAVSTDQQAALDPENGYATGLLDVDWGTLAAVAAIAAPLAEAAIRDACGRPAHPRRASVEGSLRAARPGPVVDGIEEMPIADLGAASDTLAAGAWRSAAGLAGSLPGERAIGRWAEGRLQHGEQAGLDEPATVHLGADVLCAAGEPVRSPLDGDVVNAGEDEVVLRHEVAGGPVWLRIAGIEPAVAPGEDVRGGQTVGRVAASDMPHAHLQLCLEDIDPLPGLAQPSLAEAWLALCPDPSPLLGRDVHFERRPARALRRRRERAVAAAQQLYYADPPEIVRGWRHHLYDADGRSYLDMVNNVAIAGHSHPAITEAAHRQMRLQNTNSRFLYESMTRFAERLLELVPHPLDRVFLVNSGSEANDLALRLARAHTGRHDVIAVEGAYHGWTAATFEISTSPVDNPEGAGSPAPGVHVVPQANTYRGPFGADDPQAGRRYAEHVREACRASGGPAAFICEAQLGNTGGLLAPPGYLREAFEHVRAAGGLCIADEVQVGYGRLGGWFWAFEQQGAVPDIVTIAKATGNGHPVGAVITTSAIADSLGRRASFFSSVGGGPVSCEVGIAVLDVLRDERLQHNAASTGEQLRRGLMELAGRHDLIGAVHGAGLYLGVELVRNRETKEPAVAEAGAVCERMLELGSIVQPTGDFMNVLKVKPPLCIDPGDASCFVESLDHTLTQGW
jgi:4-aminobutyrate aminotransferase-like enzyme/Ser/Thr protein kinase RdoA (MazF antagonist)